MKTMKIENRVVQVSEADAGEYLRNGWHPVPRKVWKRSEPGRGKDGELDGSRIDPVATRKLQRRRLRPRFYKSVSRSKY